MSLTHAAVVGGTQGLTLIDVVSIIYVLCGKVLITLIIKQ